MKAFLMTAGPWISVIMLGLIVLVLIPVLLLRGVIVEKSPRERGFF